MTQTVARTHSAARPLLARVPIRGAPAMANDESDARPRRPSSSPAAGSPAAANHHSAEPTVFGRFGKWLLVALLVIAGDGDHQPRTAATTATSRPPTCRRRSTIRSPATPRKKIAIIDVSGAIMEGEDGFVKRQIDRVREDRRRRRRRAARQFARRHRHRQRLHLSPPARAGRRSASCRWSSAWAASARAAATTSRWPSATSPTPSSPSRRPGPARSA